MLAAVTLALVTVSSFASAVTVTEITGGFLWLENLWIANVRPAGCVKSHVDFR
jgi:hypothetical protein